MDNKLEATLGSSNDVFGGLDFWWKIFEEKRYPEKQGKDSKNTRILLEDDQFWM